MEKEQIITTDDFLVRLSYYIKMAIFINKGTDKEVLLDKLVELYNVVKPISDKEELSDDNRTLIRKILKRLNLQLKIDEDKPVDITKSESQVKIIHWSEHGSIRSNNVDEMLAYSEKYNVKIFKNIPLSFIIRPNKYQGIIWQYTRALFYISQILVCSMTSTQTDTEQLKNNIINDSLDILDDIFAQISDLETETQIGFTMSQDQFLVIKLESSDKKFIEYEEAKSSVKDMLSSKGMGEDSTMSKLVDTVTDKLYDTGEADDGNLFGKVAQIAFSIIGEKRDMLTLDMNREQLENSLKDVGSIFKESVVKDKSKFDPELTSAIETVLDKGPQMGNDDLQNLCKIIDKQPNQDKNTQKLLNKFINIDPSKGAPDIGEFMNSLSKGSNNGRRRRR